MEDILFDSRTELDKLPFGAVSAGTKVNFGIRAAEKLVVQELFLVVVNDSNKTSNEYKMERTWTDHGYARFEGSICIEEIGIYWYHFKIVSEIGDKKKSPGA